LTRPSAPGKIETGATAKDHTSKHHYGAWKTVSINVRFYPVKPKRVGRAQLLFVSGSDPESI
jgi:hypothetical protein